MTAAVCCLARLVETAWAYGRETTEIGEIHNL
jgi:hypothetical protein